MSVKHNIGSETDFGRFGFMRVGAAAPEVILANPSANGRNIAAMTGELAENGARLALFPELSVTGYTCADLFNQSELLDAAERTLFDIAALTADMPVCIVVGAPLRHDVNLYNCAVVIFGGKIHGVVPKSFIPNYSEFYEARWFASGADISDSLIGVRGRQIPFGTDIIFKIDGTYFGIEICEDLWVPEPPSGKLCRMGADIVLNLSATDENIAKHDYLLSLISQQSARCTCAYIYASAGIGESSTDLVFSGNAIIACDGSILQATPRFRPHSVMAAADIDLERLRNDRRRRNTFTHNDEGRTKARIIDVGTPDTLPATPLARLDYVDPTPFVPEDSADRSSRCEEIISIQAWGLMQRMRVTGMKHAVIGISGGLDSTLALLVTVKTFEMLGLPRKGIIGITMPGFGTTGRTHSNAWQLMEELGVTAVEIPIGEAVDLHFRDIGHDPAMLDATYENSQARERTQILMDYANQHGALVVGTGDLSELALGWCTYNADQMSMYGVNASVPKTLVRHLIEWYADCEATPGVARLLRDIADTPISPELLPAAKDDSIQQKTEDLVGPYILHDFFLYHMLRNGFSPVKIFRLAMQAFDGKYDAPTLIHWLRNFYRRFFSQQFKRSAMPDGPKVGSACLSPRGDWRMPSDASSRLWLDQLDELEKSLELN